MSPVIQLEGIHKTYLTAEIPVRAVRDVSLTITKGEFVAVMGASGSGKSSLMNLLGCLDQPSQGSYRLDGVEVSQLNRDARAGLRNRKLGFVFQSFNLLPRTTALENVELPMICGGWQKLPTREIRARARACLERVGLADRLGHFPAQLSGGQQQRVALARAIVNQPEVILADEPTGNLDSETSIEVMALLQELNAGGITVVMVTHEPDIARYAKRMILMRDGKITRDVPIRERLSAERELLHLRSAATEAAPGSL